MSVSISVKLAQITTYTTEAYTIPEEELAASAGSSAAVSYAVSSAAADAAQEVVAAPPFVIDLTPHLDGQTIVPGSLYFTWGGNRYTDRLGVVYKNPDPATGTGSQAGTINYATGVVTLDVYDSGSNVLNIISCQTRFGRQFVTGCSFRTPGAPLRPGSFTILGVLSDGTQISATANYAGKISGTGVDGTIDVDTGIVFLRFGWYVTQASAVGQDWYHPELNEDDGTTWKTGYAYADQLYYACVVYSYIPVDADIIGIDPVRLPTDGRVPIFRDGEVVVIHNTQADTVSTLTAGQQLTLSRAGVSAVRIYDSTGIMLPTTLYSWNKNTQILTMANPLSLTGYVGPYVINHRIEDMRLVSDAQISGQITLTRGVSHDYPVDGTYVSSAVLYGDLKSRLYNMFDQKTWTSVWSDDRIGDATTANYNDVDYPPEVTNSGAVTERWALVFTSSTNFNVIGEHVGVIATGYITNDLQPINDKTNKPYFKLFADGFGTGWATGNVIRFNTEAAAPPTWFLRCTLSGEETEPSDEFTVQIRGDAQ